LRDADNIQKEVRATADKIYPDIVWRSEVYLNKGANCVRVAARFRDDQGERKTPPKGHLAINEAEVIVLNRFTSPFATTALLSRTRSGSQLFHGMTS
jgi:hypothetical protein